MKVSIKALIHCEVNGCYVKESVLIRPSDLWFDGIQIKIREDIQPPLGWNRVSGIIVCPSVHLERIIK